MDTFFALKFLAQLPCRRRRWRSASLLAGVLALVGWRRLARLVVALGIAETLSSRSSRSPTR